MPSHSPRRKPLSTLLAVLLLAILPAASWLSAADFAHEESDLPVDPNVRYGKLDNGVRYALLKNTEPRERTALRLLVETGSLQENENQRGLAHFLEHMAFNGTENYAPDTLIEFFQRMGMSFGADTNAFTSFDRTVYMIDLPDSTAAHLTEGLQVFRDYAGGMLFLPEEIDKERGIILSEKRTRDSVEWRSFVAELDFLYGDTRLAHRLPIGTEEVLSTANRDVFVDYYNTWYRPERMTVVAVGDFDIDQVESEITAAFSDLSARGPARNDPPTDHVQSIEGLRVLHHYESEAGNVAVGIQTAVPFAEEPDTARNRLKDLPRDIALGMLNRRLAELAKQEGAPFSGGYAGAGSFYKISDTGSIELRALTGTWKEALKVAENELRRALQFGFQEPELREVIAGMRNGLEQAVRRAPTRRSPQLAMGVLSAVADETVFTTPQTDYDLVTPALDQITIDLCNAAFRELWSVPHRYVTVVGNTGADQPAEPELEIAELFSTAQAVVLDPPAQIEEVAFAYTDFGPAGEIFSRDHVADLDITLVEFANRVKLNIKQTDFSAESISMSVRIGTGQLSEPTADQPGLSVYASNTFTLGGLGAHSSDELRRILAGRNVGVGFGIGTDAFQLSGATTPDDLLLQLQLAAAYLVDPGFRPEADRQMRKGIEQYYTQLAHVPQGPLQTEVPRLLANGDMRFGLPPQDVLDQRTLDEARAWLTPELQHGAIEIALVGDLDVEAAIEAVAATFGALPTRGAKPLLYERRQVSFPEPFEKDYTVPTEIPKGVVSIYWPTTDGKDVHVARRLNVLANILGDRMRKKIREELGGSYSPSAGSNTSDTFDDYGTINAYIVVDPPDAARLAAATRELAAELAAHGTNDDELQRALQPILTSLREGERTNGYWLGAVLVSAQEFPQRMDWARSRYSDNQAITVAEINKLAAAYLGNDRAFQVIVLPE
ncbi:M16 family metallopeptidase [Synoicihabitans lomoniglobus]|uniref:Insulinase family protein n=1 Tax=Synoicihabitans lomoniglobus TaxID=2909285 RepID=A0AAF0CQD3_9BACT|nr:insulinase family protein [Opitutaceae bacterium LMO-M01]WED66107.1 insulinase family protein [Opitutaceae bacterium LMO-M01]